MKASSYLIPYIFFTTLWCVAQDEKINEFPLNAAPEGFELLFNGNNFEGWEVISKPQEKIENLFMVHDGIIHVYSDSANESQQPFAGLLTQNEYQDYILTLEYKWGDKKFKPRTEAVRDAGLLFHVINDEPIWPSSAECQIQEGDTGDLWLIGHRGSSLVDASQHHYSPKGKLTKRGGGKGKQYQSFTKSFYWEKEGWNQVKIEVRGANAKFIVNNRLVNELIDLEYFDKINKEWKPMTKGKILLQAEGAEIYYKNIYIKSF